MKVMSSNRHRDTTPGSDFFPCSGYVDLHSSANYTCCVGVRQPTHSKIFLFYSDALMFGNLLKSFASHRDALISVAVFEAYFLYFEVTGFVQYGVPANFFWWISSLAKIGLGYLCFILYTSGTKKRAILGAAFAVIFIAGIYVGFNLYPAVSESIIGGHFLFMITANSAFAYRYFTDPDILSRHSRRFDLQYVLIIAIIAILAIWIQNAIEDLALLLAWILFYLRTEGILSDWTQTRS